MTDKIWQKIKETNSLANRQILYYESIDSTNVKAAEIAKNSAACGTVIIANTQTKGRGRLDRPWQSPPATGLYFSLIWHSCLPPQHLSTTTLAAGLGLCNAVSAGTNLSPLIKWPNDLLLHGKKVGGILTENCGMIDAKTIIIIGVGLNVNTEQNMFSADLSDRATSLCISAQRVWKRGDILVAALNGIEQELMRLEKGDMQGVLADFRKKDATYGRQMSWLTPARKIVRGVSLGVDDKGLLRVQDHKGVVHEVLSGDLSLAE